jgi:hypothetical protein
MVGGLDGRIALRDVVDPALDDQRLGVGGAVVQPPGDLVGALAEDAAVVKPQLRVRALRPVLVLAAQVVAEPERLALCGVGVIPRRPRGDRVAEGGDRELSATRYRRSLRLARPAAGQRRDAGEA